MNPWRDVARVARCLTFAVVVVGVPHTLHAQGGPGGPPITEPTPQSHGQWSGPWDLAVAMKRNPNTEPPSAYSPVVTEIAHSIVVPPSSPADVASSEYRGWVMFMVRRGPYPDPPPPDMLQPSYLWDPNDPGVIEDEHHVYFDNPLTMDVFCSGHTYLGDGRPVTGGGQDSTVTHIEGQSQSYVLDTIGAGPSGIPQWLELGNPTQTERWYPTLSTLSDGRLLQVGDSPECPGGGHGCGDPWRTYFDPVTETWSAPLLNRREGSHSTDCTLAEEMEVSHYPRLHLLSSGEIMWADGIESGSVGSHAAYFLKVDPLTQSPDCAADAGNPFQWREGPPAPGDTHVASQKGAPTAHILWPDGTQPDGWAEVVYQFGGTVEPHDDSINCLPDPQTNESPTNRVARLVDPDDSQPWDITGVEDMSYGRVNSNAVILLDGSVLLVGGLDHLPRGNCQPRRITERFKPEEVFGGSPFDVHWRWQDMDEQLGERGYHSVAGLLPDGRVFSAGGRWMTGLMDDWNSVELYSPPYMFSLQPRPVIIGSFTDSFVHGEPIDFDLKIRGGGELSRLALLRPGNATHAFDMSQRYIVLEEADTLYVGNDTWSVSADIPANPSAVPPGWYLLTAIGGPGKVPSAGKWVKIENM